MGKLSGLIKTQLVKNKVKRKPDPRVWIFSSTDNSHYNYNSRYLFEYVRAELPEITPYFVINDYQLRRKLSEQYGEEYFIETNSGQGIQKVLEAGVWFTSAGLPVYGTHLNSDRVIVNLWHGIPLKKIALMDPNLGKMARVYFRKIFTENYTWILTCSKALIPIMAESFAIEAEKIKVWGQPRNDMFFKENAAKEILKKIYPDLPEYRGIILYAPTFRDYASTELFPFEDYDKDKLEAFLEEEKLLICLRTHISEKGTAEKYLSGRVVYLGNEQMEDIMEILNIFDLLITDYSSIYIDYLILNRPMIFLPYDKERYLQGRGMNFEYDKVTPGAKPESLREFMDRIHETFSGKDPYFTERQRCNDFFNEVRQPCMKKICEEVKAYVHID